MRSPLFASDVDDAQARAEARRLVRAFPSESLSMTRTASVEEASRALVNLDIPDADRLDIAEAVQRAERYTAEARQQDGLGRRASAWAAVLSFMMIPLGVVTAVVFAMTTFGQEQLTPLGQRFGVWAPIEVILLAPTALIPASLLWIAAEHWKGRTHGRAVLRTAAGDELLHSSGIPQHFPWHGVLGSWGLLRRAAENLLIGYCAVLILAFFIARDSGQQFRDSPMVLIALYAVPVFVVFLVARARTAVWTRRREVMEALLYRHPDDVEAATRAAQRWADDEDEDDLYGADLHPGDSEHSRRLAEDLPTLQTGEPNTTQWRSGFSPTDSPVDAGDSLQRDR